MRKNLSQEIHVGANLKDYLDRFHQACLRHGFFLGTRMAYDFSNQVPGGREYFSGRSRINVNFVKGTFRMDTQDILSLRNLSKIYFEVFSE